MNVCGFVVVVRGSSNDINRQRRYLTASVVPDEVTVSAGEQAEFRCQALGKYTGCLLSYQN